MLLTGMRRVGALPAVRGAKARSFATEVTVSPPRPGPTIRQRLTWFMTGFAVTAGMGIYQLASDASEAATSLDSQLKLLREETHSTQTNLRARIAQLETELAKRGG